MNINDFLSIHKRVIQEHQLSLMLSNDISRQRQLIDQTIKKLLCSLRSFCFLDTWYPRLSMTDITSFIQSSIYKRENRQVFDNPSSLPFSTTVTLKINSFLKAFPNFMGIFLECVVSYFNSPHTDPEYNPCDKPLLFFASSTFPSLFGYGWCVEQGASYVEALVSLMKLEMNRTSSLLSSEFRNSFMREVVRQFMHMVGVQKYLQFALSASYWKLINDENLNGAEQESKQWFEILLSYVKEFESELLGSLCHMSDLLKYFFFRISQIDDSSLLIEFAFFDYMLQPALFNPKLFALIPETAPAPSSSCLTALTRLIRWTVNPKSIPAKYEFIKNIPVFSEIKMRSILKRLSKFEGVVNGVYSSSLQEITDMKFHLLLLSVNDILFITKIVNESIEKISSSTYSQTDKDKLKNMCNIIIPLESDELVDLWYQAFKLPELPKGFPVPETVSQSLVLPIILFPSVLPPFNPKDEFTKVILHLINYLQGLRPSKKAPNTLNEFLDYQKKHAVQVASTEWATRTQAIQAKLERSGKSIDEILNALNDTLNKGLKDSSCLLSHSFRHQKCLDELEQFLNETKKMNSQLAPIAHQSLIRLYLERHNDVKEDIGRNRLNFLTKQNIWIEFLVHWATDVIAFAHSLGLDNSFDLPITKQFHSELCDQLSFTDFKTVNKVFPENDKKVVEKYDDILTSFLSENRYKKNLKKLFRKPNPFSSTVTLLRNGTKAGAPLERLEQIESSINQIYNIYKIEACEDCPASDFTPLLIFVLLNAKLPELSSLSQYIQFYLISTNDKMQVLDANEKYCASTFLGAAGIIIRQAVQ